MWILITKKIACECAPPKLSIFWAVPWPHENYQKDYIYNEREDARVKTWNPKRRGAPAVMQARLFPLADGTLMNDLGLREQDWQGAMKIHHGGREVRVFPDEFIHVSDDNLEQYIGESHVLMPGSSPAEVELVAGILDPENKDQRLIYDAALVDGADHAQAIMTALGGDPTKGMSGLPPIGWYKCKPEYAYYFCRDWEMEPEDLEYLKLKAGESKVRRRPG